jgi:beta-alanine degradation protein BauB
VAGSAAEPGGSYRVALFPKPMKRVPPAQKLVMKNRYVRVWEMVVQPGKSYPLHRHRYPYLSICLEGATLDLFDGTGRRTRLTLRPGDVVWEVPPEVHSVRNVGRTKFRNRLVELTGAGARSARKA